MIFTQGKGTEGTSISKLQKDIKELQTQVEDNAQEITNVDEDLQSYKNVVALQQSEQNTTINTVNDKVTNLQSYTEDYVEQNQELIETQVLRTSEYVETPLLRAVNAEIDSYDTAIENINEHLSQIDDEQHTQNINIETNRLNIEQTDSNIENNIERRLSDLEEKMKNEGSIPLGEIDTMRVNDTLILGETIPCSYEKLKEQLVKYYIEGGTDLGDDVYRYADGVAYIKATENILVFSALYSVSSLNKANVAIDLSGNQTDTYQRYFGNTKELGVLSYQDFGEEISQALIGKDTGITKYNFYDDLYITDIISSTTPGSDDVIIHTFDVETETWKHWTYAEFSALTEEEQEELSVTFVYGIIATTNSFTFNKDIMTLKKYVTSENEEIDVTETEGLFKLGMSKKSTWGDSAIFKAYCNEYLYCLESYENVADLPSPTFNCYAFVGNTLYVWNGSTWNEIVGIYGAEGSDFDIVCPINNFTTPAIPYSKREIVTYDGKVEGTIRFEGEIKQTSTHTYIQKEVVFASGTDYGTFRIDKYRRNNISMLKFSIVSQTGIDDTSGSTKYSATLLNAQETKEMFGDILKSFTAIFEKLNMKVFVTPFSNNTIIDIVPISYQHAFSSFFTEYIVFDEYNN